MAERLYKVDVYVDRQIMHTIIVRDKSQRGATVQVFEGFKSDGLIKPYYEFKANAVSLEHALQCERCGARIWATL